MFELFTAAGRELRAKLLARQGFMHAIERRLFADLPPMLDGARLEQYRKSPEFCRGEQYGRCCPLAVGTAGLESQPGDDQDAGEHEEYPDGGQYRVAAWVSAAACIVALVVLYSVSTP